MAAWVPHFGLLAASPPSLSPNACSHHTPPIPVPQGLGAHPSAGSCPSGLPPAASPRPELWPGHHSLCLPHPAPRSQGLDPVRCHPSPPARASTRQRQTRAVVLKPRPRGQGLPDTGRERVSNTDEAELPARPPLFIWRSRMPATKVWTTTLREHSAHKLPCHVIRSVDPCSIRPRQEVHPWTQLPVLGSLRDTGIPSSSPGRGKWARSGLSADDGPR